MNARTNAARVISSERPPAPCPNHGLTPHEVRILNLLADGSSYSSVGERLNVSINTVRNYIRSIYDKLNVHSKSAAVCKGLRTGII